ncbi:MAG: hypothetical protein H6702_23260 [Myxococcales bacterium]|nr:hypothetical protein [Myxococcales bacterium]
MHRALTALALIFAALLATGCAAHASVASARGYSVELVDEYGNRLPTYHHGGRTYVLGHYNHRYQVRVQNHTGERVEAVITVDGRDVVSGDVGDYKSQRGYIVQPYGQVTVDGFRQSLNNVATFRFTDPGDSYSARRGTPQHVGVVGVAVFAERHRPVVRRPIARPEEDRDFWGYNKGRGGAPTGATADAPAAAPRKSAEAESSADAMGGADEYAPRARSKNNLGTRYGESRHSAVVEVPFERGSSSPRQVLAVYYDNAQGLQARGIHVYPTYGQVEPDPFPAQRFAPPPN